MIPVPAFVIPFPNMLSNNLACFKGIISPSYLFSVSLTPFSKMPPNNEEATVAINEAFYDINELTNLPPCFFTSSFTVSVAWPGFSSDFPILIIHPYLHFK